MHQTVLFIDFLHISGTQEDKEAMDMLVGNAQSLMLSVSTICIKALSLRLYSQWVTQSSIYTVVI